MLTEGSDYSIVLAEDEKYGTGFAAIAIKDPDNNVTVATRGTEGISLDYDSSKDVVEFIAGRGSDWVRLAVNKVLPEVRYSPITYLNFENHNE